jgi:flagellar biosynthesis/type III secretory pathway protein FliH
MNTKVNIVLNPTEFDLVRQSVKESAQEHEILMNNKDLDPGARRVARETAAQLRDLEGKLNS